MSQEIVKSSRELKSALTSVRLHLNAVERAGDLLKAQIKRAEADYVERITHATDVMRGIEEEAPTAAPVNGQPSEPTENPQ